MLAARTVNSWTKAWGVALLSLGISYNFAARAQQDTLTDRAEQGEDPRDHNPKHHHYKLIDLGTFGGPNTNLFTQGVGAQALNNRGVVTGSADTSTPDPNAPNCLNYDCFISHAFKWQKGSLTDLGALPGVNTSFGSWITANGLIAGESGNGKIDPLTGAPEARAVFWKDDQIVDLGTFGGNESYANAVNDRGQVVGSAANAIPDPFNTGTLYGWGTQMHAFRWEDGVMRDLGTLGGPDSLAYYVNEAGQVAGFSYTSYTPNPLTGVPPGHPFLWQNGTMHDLGTIGGTVVTQLNALNERGQVVGSMTLADEDPNHIHPFLWDGKTLLNLGTLGGDFGEADWLNDAGEVVGNANTSIACPGGAGPIGHAFLWKSGVMRDLGVVPGIDPLQGASGATGINSKTQIVGTSNTCDNSAFDAFLWENGSMADLNTLIPPDSSMHLSWAVYINDRSEITGYGVLPNGDVHTFLLIPCEENHADVEGCDYDMVDEAAAAAPSNSAPMTGGLAAATSTQHSTSSEMLAAGRARMLRLPHIPGAAIHAGVASVGSVTVSDSQAPAVQKIAITSGTPPQGMVGRAYDVHCHIPLCGGSIVVGFPLTASGGVPPYSWTWTPQAGSSLPPSLSISHHFGLHGCVSLGSGYGICGTPTIAGSYNVTAKVTDSASPPAYARANYTIDID